MDPETDGKHRAGVAMRRTDVSGNAEAAEATMG